MVKKQYKQCKPGREDCQFSRDQLSKMFGISVITIRKKINGVIPTKTFGRQGDTFDIADVAELLDVRDDEIVMKHTTTTNPGKNTPKKPAKSTSEETPVETDDDGAPVGASPAQLKVWFQAKTAEQEYLAKKTKNEIEDGVLLVASDVEKGLASTLKTLIQAVDTLPDSLENQGIITGDQIHSVAELTDTMRAQIIDDLNRVIE